MNKKSKTFLGVGIALGLLIVIMMCAGYFMVGFSLSPRENRADLDAIYERSFRYDDSTREYADSLKEAGILLDTFVVINGANLHALYARNEDAHGRTAVVVHGYKDNAYTFLYLARIYREKLGYNILLPDLYAHGFSEGDAIRMGWKDRLDVLKWCEIASKDFASDSLDTPQIIVHGVSMGAATTMCLSGEDTPDYIKCFVEDCGYTTVWEEFKGELKNQFGLPAFPLLYVANALCKSLYGWSFREASPLNAIARCEKPMLMIHGDADTFVPFSMFRPLVDAKPEPKEVWVVPGAEHARSFTKYPEEYTTRVVEFANKYMK